MNDSLNQGKASSEESYPDFTRLVDYKPPEYLTPEIVLVFDIIDATRVNVTSTLTVIKNPASSDSSGVVELDCKKEIDLESVEVGPMEDGAVIDDSRSVQQMEGKLRIKAGGEHFKITIKSILDLSANQSGLGLYRSGDLITTQCEPDSFSRIVPSVDRPDNLAKFTVTIRGNSSDYPELLSNGNLTGEADLGDGRHERTYEDPFLKPTYLFALAAGKLETVEDVFTTMSGREVRIKVLVEPGKMSQADIALQELKRAFKHDEERWGLECDLDEYKVVAADNYLFGAMENKGLNIFNSKYVLATHESSTDSDIRGISRVLAHEYHHNWSGNRVTLRDWFNIAVKEGFTVFREQVFMGDMWGKIVERIHAVKNLRDGQFSDDAGSSAMPVRPDKYESVENIYNSTTYEKAAELVRMLQTMMGEANFRKAFDLYFKRHDGQAVTTEQFIACMQDCTDIDLTQFEETWYHQEGTPSCKVSTEYNPDAQIYSLTIEQTPGRAEQRNLHFPLVIGLLNSQGDDMPLSLMDTLGGHDLQRGVLHIREGKQTFVFTGIKEKPIPSLFRSFSAPVKVESDLSDEEKLFLMENDNDAFNRYDVAYQIASSEMIRLIRDNCDDVSEAVIKAFGRILEKADEEIEVTAEMLDIPSSREIAEQIIPYEYQKAYDTRIRLMRTIAERYEKRLLELYEKYHCTDGQIEITPAAMAARRIKNICLAYLVTLGEKHKDIIIKQFENANNMTDELTALSLATQHKFEGYEEIIQAFYEKWKSEVLVFQSWVRTIASSSGSGPQSIKKLKEISQLPEFDSKVPNYIYDLYIGLGGNDKAFHSPDGVGYQFIADKIIELDQQGSSVVAARLAKLFQHASRMDEGRALLIKVELQRIAGTPSMSKEVMEHVNNTLRGIK